MERPIIVCHGLLSSDVQNSFAVMPEHINDFLQQRGDAYKAFVELQEKRRADYDAMFMKLKAEDPSLKYNKHDWKTGGFEFYERTQPCIHEGDANDDRKCLNRVYVDVDGKVGAMNRNDFDELNETIQQSIHFAISFPHSLMTASQWNKDGNSKLSFRITLLKKHGSKPAIAKYVEDRIYPLLKEALSELIPLEMKTDRNKKQLTEDKFEEQNQFLLIDSGVYNPKGRKMRMLGQSKPNEKRPNVFGEADAEGATVLDTLITYVPSDSEPIPEIEEVAEPVKPKKAKPTFVDDDEKSNGTADPAPPQMPVVDGKAPLIERLADALPAHRWDDYTDWITSGFICFNEGLSVEFWEQMSKKSQKFKAGECAKAWAGFRKDRLSQERWWAWLRSDDLPKYLELVKERKSFWELIKNPNHAEMAQFFWNTKPDGYVFNETLKWFQLLPTNAWKHYNQAPSGLMTDVWRTLKQVAKDHEHLINWSSESEDWRRKPFKDFMKSIGVATVISGVIQFLPTCYNDDDLVKKMDENRDVFAFLDKVYDTKAKCLRDIKPSDWVCLTTGYKAPKASNPAVRKEIDALIYSMWEDKEVSDYLKRTIGSCISGTRRFEEFYIWTGKGGNGKGVLSTLVQKAFGNYFHSFSHTMLTKAFDKKEAPNPALADAKGKRFSQGTEPEAEDKLQEGFVKLLTGNDPVSAARKYENPITFTPQCGWWLQCNEIPKFNKMTGGSKRRVKVLMFPFQFVDNPQSDHERKTNNSLKEKIGKCDDWRDEFILMMIEAYNTIGDSMGTPAFVDDATATYMNKSNPCNDWLSEHYVRTDSDDKEKAISSEELLEQFKADKPSTEMSAERFKSYMELIGIKFKRIGTKFKGKVLDMEKSHIDADGTEHRVMTAEMERKSGNYWWGLERKIKVRANDEQNRAAEVIQGLWKR